MTAVGVVGEAVVDLLPHGEVLRPSIGGSPLNVAVALARLGVDTHLLSATSTDGWGTRVRQHLAAEGVHADGPTVDDPTALAVVDVAADGQPSYRFLWDDTADGHLDADALLAAAGGLDALHVGSVAAVRGAAGAALPDLIGTIGDDMVVSYDPNARPDVMGDLPTAVARIRRLAGLAHVVKASVEDLAVLAPDRDPRDAARELLAGDRTALVVVTHGADGADLLTSDLAEFVPARAVPTVVDTVGAGDTFMAGLLVGLADRGALSVGVLRDLDATTAREAATFATRAAGVVVGRQGADPPRRSDLESDLR